MSLEVVLLLAVLAFMIAAFVREWLPLDVVAMPTMALVLLFGLVEPEEAVAGFSNAAVITVMMMFILSDALVHSGLVGRLAHHFTNLSGRTPAELLEIGPVYQEPEGTTDGGSR